MSNDARQAYADRVNSLVASWQNLRRMKGNAYADREDTPEFLAYENAMADAQNRLTADLTTTRTFGCNGSLFCSPIGAFGKVNRGADASRATAAANSAKAQRDIALRALSDANASSVLATVIALAHTAQAAAQSATNYAATAHSQGVDVDGGNANVQAATDAHNYAVEAQNAAIAVATRAANLNTTVPATPAPAPVTVSTTTSGVVPVPIAYVTPTPTPTPVPVYRDVTPMPVTTAPAAAPVVDSHADLLHPSVSVTPDPAPVTTYVDTGVASSTPAPYPSATITPVSYTPTDSSVPMATAGTTVTPANTSAGSTFPSWAIPAALAVIGLSKGGHGGRGGAAHARHRFADFARVPNPHMHIRNYSKFGALKSPMNPFGQWDSIVTGLISAASTIGGAAITSILAPHPSSGGGGTTSAAGATYVPTYAPAPAATGSSSSNNTMMYVGIGGAFLLVVIMMMNNNKKK